MTPKQRQLLKEMVRKEILKKIDKPIKLQDLISENYRNWEIGKVMTMKDNPPFKTPKQVEEEKLSEKRRPPKDEYFVKQVTTVSKAINDMLRIFPKTSFGKDKNYLKMLKMIDKELVNNTKKILGYNESVKEGKLTEAKQGYVVADIYGGVYTKKAVSEKKALAMLNKMAHFGGDKIFMIGVEAWNKPHKMNKKKIMVKEEKLTSEQKLREQIREIIKEQLNEKKETHFQMNTRDMKDVDKLLRKGKFKGLKMKAKGPKFILTVPKKMEDKVLSYLIQKNVKNINEV